MNYANEFGLSWICLTCLCRWLIEGWHFTIYLKRKWRVSVAKISLHGTTLVAIADINIPTSNQHFMKSVTLVIRASDFAWTVSYLSHVLYSDVVSIEAKYYFAFTKIDLSWLQWSYGTGTLVRGRSSPSLRLSNSSWSKVANIFRIICSGKYV
jgi:hypothetical protein